MTPRGWADALEAALSRACGCPSVAVAVEVSKLLDAEPDAGLMPAWHELAATARRWLNGVASLHVPAFRALGELETAIAAKPPTAAMAAYRERMEA